MFEKYDVLFSLAGEDREKVDPVAEAVRAAGLDVFYDKFERVESFGKDLRQYLADKYRHEGTCCVVFVSEAYSRKKWPRYELAVARERASRQEQEYLLFVRLDNTQLEGVPTGIIVENYFEATDDARNSLVDLIVEKVRRLQQRQRRMIALLATLTVLLVAAAVTGYLYRPVRRVTLMNANENVLTVQVTNPDLRRAALTAYRLTFDEKLPIETAKLRPVASDATKAIISPFRTVEIQLTTAGLRTKINAATSMRYSNAEVRHLIAGRNARLEIDVAGSDDEFPLRSEPFSADRIKPFILKWVPKHVSRQPR